ncbi:MAG: formate dehydrogenase subunit delta [Hyphomicrobiales bacterium]|nr:formate dehydrogenase subunit delta [Hyphomicrobiales bacterium]
MSAVAEDHALRLATMARQIADFFRVYPQEEAARSIADHINQFWTRRMRDEFLALPGLKEGALDPLLAKAAAFVRPGSGKSGPNAA